MGAVCCCLRADREYVNPGSSLRCFLDVFIAVFQRGQVRALPSSIQEASSLSSTASIENSLSDTYRSPPRPLPYDTDPRSFRLQRVGLISKREKGSSHLHEESEPLGRSNIDAHLESLRVREILNRSDRGGSEERLSDSSVKHTLASVSSGVNYVYSSSEDEDEDEDEDECPTCLEEYTPENPKIITHCSHHFHLVCIYEWMERSEICPVCGKVMEFDETA